MAFHAAVPSSGERGAMSPRINNRHSWPSGCSVTRENIKKPAKCLLTGMADLQSAARLRFAVLERYLSSSINLAKRRRRRALHFQRCPLRFRFRQSALAARKNSNSRCRRSSSSFRSSSGVGWRIFAGTFLHPLFLCFRMTISLNLHKFHCCG